jgi:hypothetical protein
MFEDAILKIHGKAQDAIKKLWNGIVIFGQGSISVGYFLSFASVIFL